MPVCPLCSSSVASSSLEAHLRSELAYPSLRCGLCPVELCGRDDARRHFDGPLGWHPGQPERLLLLPADPAKEERLVELVRLARGGPDVAQARLCLCGRCHLVCREEDGLRQPSEQPESAPWEPPPSPAAFLPPQSPAPKRRRRSVDQREQPSSPDETLFAAPGMDQTELEAPALSASSWEPPSGPGDQNASRFAVKSEPEDVKPQAPSDGKVACLLCGLRVGKDRLKTHAIGAHTSARPYQCGQCHVKTKAKGELAKHQKSEHGVKLGPDTFLFTGSGAGVERQVEECFGSVHDVDWARLRCQPCDKVINKMLAKRHISEVHIKKAMHSCRLCDFTVEEFSAGRANAHVKKVHGKAPGPETLDSSTAQHYAPILKSMVDELFVPV